MKKLNKKGMFFTLMSMLLIAMLTLALTSPPKNATGIDRLEPETTRIKVMNDLIQSLETIFIPAIIQSTTYNILEDTIQNSPAPTLSELNGILKLELEEDAALGSTASFVYWFNELNKSINEVYHTDLTLKEFEFTEITQQDNSPYEISINYYLEYTLNENSYPGWNITGSLHNDIRTTQVSISGLTDPIFPSEKIIPAASTEGTIPADRYIVNSAFGETFLTRLIPTLYVGLQDPTNKICSENSNGGVSC